MSHIYAIIIQVPFCLAKLSHHYGLLAFLGSLPMHSAFVSILTLLVTYCAGGYF